VARRAPVAEQLHRGPRVVADRGQVLVAVAVELAGAHHDVAPAGPHPVEHRSVRVPVLEDPVLGGDERRVVVDEGGLAVGDAQVGLERGPGQASGDHRDRADRVGEDLAVAPEALGERDDADLGPGGGRRGHRPSRTLRWYSSSGTSTHSARYAAYVSGEAPASA